VSLNSLANLAVQRDAGTPAKTAVAAEDENPATEAQNWTDVLTAAIPTEALALYTFLTGAIIATISAGEDERLTMRWIIYVAGFVIIAAYLFGSYHRAAGKRKRRLPLREFLSASIAFAAWGLVMPGSPLLADLSSEDDRAVWTAIIIVSGIVLLWLVGKPLQKPAK
jgi:hypothetical protein